MGLFDKFKKSNQDTDNSVINAVDEEDEDSFEDDDDYYSGSSYEYSGNPGCNACGNPAYPDCKASCPMFDD